MKRIFDCTAVLAALFLFGLPMLLVALLVKLTSPGPVLYWSDRVGMGNGIFKMPKFRTMRIDTPAVATHLLTGPDAYLTPLGPFLRKSSLDEMPQLWSVLKGNHYKDDFGFLILNFGLFYGWDVLAIPVKVEFDAYYLKHRSFIFDVKILLMTLLKVVRREGARH
ncbi:MAG: sugar transferase [Syntrophales bacterium]|nr:sugar transferase [Syntrophales bacterium]